MPLSTIWMSTRGPGRSVCEQLRCTGTVLFWMGEIGLWEWAMAVPCIQGVTWMLL